LSGGSPGAGKLVGNNAELAQRSEVIATHPMLDCLAVLQAVDVDLGHSMLLPVGGMPLLLFTNCLEEVFSETRIRRCESSCVRIGPKGYFASR
jgi:hypothetical protein